MFIRNTLDLTKRFFEYFLSWKKESNMSNEWYNEIISKTKTLTQYIQFWYYRHLRSRIFTP